MEYELYKRVGSRICLIGQVLVVLFMCSVTQGQGIAESYNKTLEALGKKDHGAALKLCDQTIAQYGTAEEGMDAFGPVYGHWFYMRGLAKMGVEQWGAACADFEICYSCTSVKEEVKRCKTCLGFGRVTTNKPLGQRAADGKMPCPVCNGVKNNQSIIPNQFRMHSLVHWGNCEMVQENYAKARPLYEKALLDEEKLLKYNWKLYAAVNLGRCMIKSGEVEEGYKYIVRPLESERFPLSLKQIVFQVLVDDWAPLVDPSRVLSFIDEYRYIPLSADAEQRAKRNPNYYYLANDAMQKGDPVLALTWYRLVAHPADAISKMDHKIELYTARKESDKRPEVIPLLDAEIKKVTESRDLIAENFWSMQGGMGMAHHTLKNFGASFSVFSKLSDFAPKGHSGRPEFLHNAVFAAVQIDDWKSAYRYGMTFFEEFPDHELKPAVTRVVVEMIFIQGDYQKSYDIAKEVRVEMETGSEMREIPDFVVGASAYQLGKYDEAESELTTYLKTYDPGQRKELAQYFLASAKVKNSKWQEGCDIFDPFLKEFPQSSVTSSVLYQNGLCKFMLNDNHSCMGLVDRLLQEFPNAPDVPGASNLRGDVQTVEEADFDTAIALSYKHAIVTSANFSGQEEIAAYAMWQLLMNLVGEERWEEAEVWFDQFQEQYPESVYSVDMLLGALDMLVELNRTEEAVSRLEGVIYQSGKNVAGGNLSELFGSYLDFIKGHDADNAQSRLDALVSSDESSVALKAWARIGKIQLLEAAEGDHDAAIQALFSQLKHDFDPVLHSNYVIVRLARWLTTTRQAPQEAAPMYDYILANREGSVDFDLALLDRAEIDAQSDEPEDRARATEYFQRVLNESKNTKLAENASVGVARLLMKENKLEDALVCWEAYMDNDAWNNFSAEANYTYGVCLDRLGKSKEALVVYINTYNAYPGYVDYSMPSYIRAALIMKENGSDLKALLILKDMLTRMRDINHPNKDKALVLFNKWRSEYVPPKKEEGE